MFKPSYLVKGFPGHPLHPPLTDASIGAYTAATVLGILAYAGVSEENLTKAWWLALLVGLGSTALTASTGLADWLGITRGTPLWWTATWHMVSMLTATTFFLRSRPASDTTATSRGRWAASRSSPLSSGSWS